MNTSGRITTVFFAAGMLTLIAASSGQHDDLSPGMTPFGEVRTHQLDSGVRANTGMSETIAFADVVRVEDAAWIRLYFADIVLDGGSRIRISSLLDGDVQELDAEAAQRWSNNSAYFNGDSVLIELIAAPGTRANRFVLAEVGVEIRSDSTGGLAAGSLCGLCDVQDHRVPSNEQWVGRLVSPGGICTVSVINEQSCAVTAGQCITSNMVAQFNVPLSSPGCHIHHPPAADQFPVTGHLAQNAGVGADWAVLTLGSNGDGPFDAYGAFRPIAAEVPSSGEIEVWGYGQSHDCTLNYTQQYGEGEIIIASDTVIAHTAPTTVGSMGAALLFGGEIIGVATHCTTFTECPPNGNIATHIGVPEFVEARDELCSDQCASPADLNCDGVVNVSDLLILFDNWGPCADCDDCDADLNGDCVVNVSDLLILFDSWG
jgi:trimeric autotransporter adhesin